MRLGVDASIQTVSADPANSHPPALGGIQEALVFGHCANLNPIKYMEGLAEAVVRRGGWHA